MQTTASKGIRRVVDQLNPDPAPDGELLARYLKYRDEAAFGCLVRRHAAMVFGTCRRVLGNMVDADDAFQATFLVLVRKAHSLMDRTCIGNFLYGVAYHTALKARAMALKRRMKEAESRRRESSSDQAELLKALDEELARLPEKYREPVVLCELEGRSRQEVSSSLGIPEGTISSRLATAHRMLEKRLKRRGFASVCVATVLAGQAIAVTDSLENTAVRGVAEPSIQVSHLASEVAKMLLIHKLGMGVSALMIIALALSLSAAHPRDVAVEKLSTVRLDEPKPAAKAVPVAEPAWKKEFRKTYGLKDGELLRRVAPPYPDCRAEYFRNLDQEFYKQNKIDPDKQLDKDYSDHFVKLGWKDGWTVDRLISRTTGVKPEEGLPLASTRRMSSSVLNVIFGLSCTRIEGEDELLGQKVTGDFIVRAGANSEHLAAALEKILRKECDLPVSLTFKEVERNVYVLSGKYEAKPLPGNKKNEIEIYANELTKRIGDGWDGASGDLQGMIPSLEEWINTPVFLGKIESASDGVCWHFNYRSDGPLEVRPQDTEPDAVMKNITLQTGLKAKLEKRKVKVLEVKRAP